MEKTGKRNWKLVVVLLLIAVLAASAIYLFTDEVHEYTAVAQGQEAAPIKLTLRCRRLERLLLQNKIRGTITTDWEDDPAARPYETSGLTGLRGVFSPAMRLEDDLLFADFSGVQKSDGKIYFPTLWYDRSLKNVVFEGWDNGESHFFLSAADEDFVQRVKSRDLSPH